MQQIQNIVQYKKTQEQMYMARKPNQKGKLLMLAKLFKEESDEQHPFTLKEIIDRLDECDIPVERKTVYTDMEILQAYGMDIIMEDKGKQCFYYLGSRDFELAEIKLLVDAVQSSKFITEKKSNMLIKKLEGLVSKYQAGQLKRQVIINGRVKTMNESIYYNVDKIHEAIGAKSKIRFQYFQWNYAKQMVLRKQGEYYEVSPYCLMWDDENYYLVAYDAQSDILKHYRVDKMQKIHIVNQPLEGKELFAKFNVAEYTHGVFGMFGGAKEHVTLRCKNELAGVMIDRFGKNVPLQAVDEEHFQFAVDVYVSRQFFAWLFSLGKGVKLLGPSHVLTQMQEELAEVYQNYM